MTAKDRKIIDANPGADIYQLTEAGMSNKGIDEYIDSLKNKNSNKLQASVIEEIPDFIAKPILSQPTFIQSVNKRIDDEVGVINLAKQNTIRTMTRKAAVDLVRRFPGEFKLAE